MKAFMPYLLVPALAAIGWVAGAWVPTPPAPQLPGVATVEAPPQLGVPVPAPPEGDPVRVHMRALLPPGGLPETSRVGERRQTPPRVNAILIDGKRRVAQVDGEVLAVGDRLGAYRVAAIETHRVLFVQTVVNQRHWIDVNAP